MVNSIRMGCAVTRLGRAGTGKLRRLPLENIIRPLIIDADRHQDGLSHDRQFWEAGENNAKQFLQRASRRDRFGDLRRAGQVFEIGIKMNAHPHLLNDKGVCRQGELKNNARAQGNSSLRGIQV